LQFSAHTSGYFATTFAVLNPEFPYTLVWMRKSQVVISLGMREECRVEIKTDLLLFGPLNPRCKMMIFNGIAIW